MIWLGSTVGKAPLLIHLPLHHSCLNLVLYSWSRAPWTTRRRHGVPNDDLMWLPIAIMRFLMVLGFGNRLILPLMGLFSSFWRWKLVKRELSSSSSSTFFFYLLRRATDNVAPQTTASSMTISCSCASASWEY